MRKSNGTLSDNSAWVFADAPTGGAGYGTGVDIHITSGRQWIGTDTCGCYVRDPGDAKWTPVFTTSTIADPTDYATWNASSTNCIRGRFAPSDKNRLYSNFNGRFYTVDIDPAKALGAAGAITATKWAGAAKRIDGGAGYNRWWDCRPSVHPTDKNIVLAGTSNDGVYYTTDGGANVTPITIPACTMQPQETAEGITTPSEAGREQYMTWIDQGNVSYCYIFVQGVGLHRSTTGISGTYSLVTGSPLGATGLCGEADGTLWFCADERANILLNPYHNTNTTSWTAGSSATLSRVSTANPIMSYLKVLNGAASAGYAYQAITTVVGYTYTITCWARADGTAVGGVMKIGTAAGLSDIASLTPTLGGQTPGQTTFVATGTTTYISLVVNSSTSGAYALFQQPLVAVVGVFNIARGGSTFTYKGNGMTGGGKFFPHHIDIDPFDANGILIWREQAGAYSTDRGTNWTQSAFIIVAGGDCTWRPKPAPQMGTPRFDPTIQNRVLCGEGFGSVVFNSYRTNLVNSVDYSAGMEQKIDVDFLHIPGNGRTYVWGMDLPNERFDSLTTYTNIPHGGPNGVEIGGQIDYAADNNNFIAQAVGSGAPDHSYSTDGGNTWAQFSGAYPAVANAYGFTSSGPHGSIAVGNSTNIVIAPTNSAVPCYTKDGGATWSPVLLGGSKDYHTNGAYYIRGRRILTSDKTRPGTFAMVVCATIPGTSDHSSPYAGLWVTTDGGDNWTQKQAGIVGHNGLTSSQVQALGYEFEQRYKCRIAYVPGYSQELLYTPYDTINSKFFYSTNDGATFTEANSLIRNVKRFDFGKNLPGATRPAVYFYGLVNSVGPAMWVTFDWFVTFTQIAGQFPGGYPSNNVASGVGADMTVFGRVFSTIEGRGSVVSSYRDVAHGT